MKADTLENFEERAAIIQFDGGLSRQEAEAVATSLVLTVAKQIKQSPAQPATRRKINPEFDKVKRILNGQ